MKKGIFIKEIRLDGITNAIEKALVSGAALVIVEKVLASGITSPKGIVDGNDEYSGSRVGNDCEDVEVKMVETDDENSWAFLLRKNMGRKEEKKVVPQRVFRMSVKAWMAKHKSNIKLRIDVEEDKLEAFFRELRDRWWREKKKMVDGGKVNYWGDLLELVFFRTENPIFAVNGILSKTLMELVEDDDLKRGTVYRAINKYYWLVYGFVSYRNR